MNRNRLLMIGTLALVLGAFVSFLVYRSLTAQGNSRLPAGMPVVVAATDIVLGARIEERDLKIIRLQSSDLPPVYYADKAKIIGRGVVLPIGRGDLILPNKLAGENAGSGLPALIPPGMRAVSVRVNEVVGVAGFVQPGTRVDVLLTGNASGGEQQTTTVLKNVAVIAAGQKLDRSSSGESQMSPVITLLVSPDDAQRLTLASMDGRIQLALRNPLDTRQDDLPAANTGTLYRNGAPVIVPVRRTAAPPRRAVAVPAPATPTSYDIEVYRGDKKDVTKFQGQEGQD